MNELRISVSIEIGVMFESDIWQCLYYHKYVDRRAFEFNWQRISRGCFFAAFVMLCWLAMPIASCSWDAWNDTPISDDWDPKAANVSKADKDRLSEGRGFFDKLGDSVHGCYKKTPLFGQEPWKNNLLYTFLGVGVLAYVLAKWQAQRNKSYVK
jgi:hypothetical protein